MDEFSSKSSCKLQVLLLSVCFVYFLLSYGHHRCRISCIYSCSVIWSTQLFFTKTTQSVFFLRKFLFPFEGVLLWNKYFFLFYDISSFLFFYLSTWNIYHVSFLWQFVLSLNLFSFFCFYFAKSWYERIIKKITKKELYYRKRKIC